VDTAFGAEDDRAPAGGEAVAEGLPRRFGDYELLEEIGRGGMGVVYRARQLRLGREVALKILPGGEFARPEVRKRFRAEALTAAQLQHPNIVAIYDVGEHEGLAFFTMDLVANRTLAEAIRGGPLPARKAATYLRVLAEAVQFAHGKGVLHRDLKPSNVLLDAFDQPRLTDFGLARSLAGSSDLTLTGQALGSPAYMPPEQASGRPQLAGPAADVYSLGAILYHLITGRPPFQGDVIHDVLWQVRQVEPVPPRTLNPSIPEDLETVCLKCLEKDPARRYAGARALADELDRFLRDEPIQARPVGAAGRLWRWCRRRPAVTALGAGVLLLLVLLAFGSTIAAWRISAARRAEQLEREKSDAANRNLRETVRLLELQRAENLFDSHDPAAGAAHLAAILRRDPSNHLAANRLVSALVHRNWALPDAPPARHPGPVALVQFSPGERWVLGVSRDHTARLSDMGTGQTIAIIRHEERILSACFSPDGAALVTASADGTARIWSTINGAPLTPPLRHDEKVHFAEFSRDGRLVVTASSDRTAKIWEASSGTLKRELRGHSSAVVLARFSPDESRIATGGSHASIRLWNADSGEMLFRLENRARPLTALVFSPDGGRLVSACEDGLARLWNTVSGEVIGVPLVHKSEVLHAVFSPDSRLLLTTANDGTARLWEAETGRPVGEALRHEGGIINGDFSPDGQTIVTASADNSARLWDVRTGMPLCQPLREREAIRRAAFTRDGRRLVTGSDDGIVQFWDIQPRRSGELVLQPEKGVTAATFSPDGDAVLTASLDQTAKLFEARTGRVLIEPLWHDSAVSCASFSPDGRHLVTACADGTARVWERNTARLIAGPLRHTKAIRTALFSPNGQRLVTASADGTARVWDTHSGEAVAPPLAHESEVVMARFSADGQRVVTASEDRSARVWDATTGQPVTARLTHSSHVKWAEFSPDGKRIATASTDNTARIWDARTGRPTTPPLQHARIVNRAVFSPDGRRVVTSSLDRTARVWDADSGQALTEPLKHDSPVSQIYFSPDGQRLLSVCWNGLVRLWDSHTGRPLTEWLDTGGWISSACFDPTGRRIATAAKGVRVWEVPPAPTPVPGWFPAFAEALAGIRLGARGNVELVPRQELNAFGGQPATGIASGFYERLAEWFPAEPSGRPGTPF
jgi:WD40 repeat protein